MVEIPYLIDDGYIRVVKNAGDDDMSCDTFSDTRIVMAASREEAVAKYKKYFQEKFPGDSVSCWNLRVKEPIL